MGARIAAVSVGLILLTASCANLQTVARTTRSPFNPPSIEGDRYGRAIHLDAQQRLVVFAAERYCAEPSPDALAAYAAAIGLSGSISAREAVSGSGALGSVAGSIGLRTQSITLMRDTLYRTCEAGLNDFLSPDQIAVLMARSQDLTAVILAIEQLTGAVAAPPIWLGASGTSSSAATLVGNTEALELAKRKEAQAKQDREDAQEQLEDIAKRLTDIGGKISEQQKLVNASPDDPELRRVLTELQGEETKMKNDEKRAGERLKLAVSLHEDYSELVSALEDIKDGGASVASARIETRGEIGSPSRISDTAASEIADSVQDMIGQFLEKPYLREACLAVMTNFRPVTEVSNALEDLERKALVSGLTASTRTRTEALSDFLTGYGELLRHCSTAFREASVAPGEGNARD